MAGLDKNGFKRKTYPEIVSSMQDKARATFGEDINLNSNSFLGMLISVTSWGLSLLWQTAEKIYFNKYVDYAEGNNLDLACRNHGVSRRGAVPATGFITFNNAVPIGLIVTKGDIIFKTISSGTTVKIEATEGGTQGNVLANSIKDIATPLPDLQIISNTPTAGGKGIETDGELRVRFFDSLAVAGAGTVGSIKTALLATEGVIASDVEEIKETVEGIEYYSGIRAIVRGGEADDIAQTIFNYKAFGIKTVGETTGTAKADNLQEFIIKFDYADVISVNVNANIITDEGYVNMDLGIVEACIQNYITKLPMGGTIIHAKLISEVLQLEGVKDVTITLNGSTANIELGYGGVAEAIITVA